MPKRNKFTHQLFQLHLQYPEASSREQLADAMRRALKRPSALKSAQTGRVAQYFKNKNKPRQK